MLQLTRKTDYALVALSHLGHRRAADAGPTSARRVSEAYNMPLPLLMNILKELAQARLVRSTRGATGGYELAVDPAEVNLLDVVTAIEGPVKLTPCCDDAPNVEHSCGLEANCPIQYSIRALHRRITGFMQQVTLHELMQDLPAPEPLVKLGLHAPDPQP
ncbi:MAG: Rrf2 family transcriptional regulator [Planctomycetota bacterium]